MSTSARGAGTKGSQPLLTSTCSSSGSRLEGKCCLLWCRAPGSEGQHVLSSPQRVTQPHAASMQTSENEPSNPSEAAQAPSELYKTYPASTSTLLTDSPFGKAAAPSPRGHELPLCLPRHIDRCNQTPRCASQALGPPVRTNLQEGRPGSPPNHSFSPVNTYQNH